jgi:hypothetical protein
MLFNEFFELRFRMDGYALWIQVIVTIIVTHFLGKVSIFNAWYLCFGEAHDTSVGFDGPVDHEIVKIATGGAENNDIVDGCHDGVLVECVLSVLMYCVGSSL